MRIICLYALWAIIGAVPASAQLLKRDGHEVHPYYISLDRSESTIEEVKGEFLHLSYRDKIGKAQTINLNLSDSKGKSVKHLKLVKQFGQNYFDIRLVDLGISLIADEVYTCRIKNEKGEVRERTIRYTPKLDLVVSASIVVRPKFLSCGKETGSDLVEFFGEVNGGRPPYTANWYVLNSNRTDFLYMPSRIFVPSTGLTSSIEVDKAPEYYVLLHVTDACGNEQVATVNIVCQLNEKKVNTLFFEKLSDAFLSNGTETEISK